MAAELQPPDALISTAPPPINTTTTTIGPAAAPSLSLDHPPKRQRRPSVRLGEIGGDPPYDSHPRRTNKTWRFHKDPTFAVKTSKTRPLTNLVNGGPANSVEPSDNYAGFGHPKPKIRKPAKKARTNWTKFDHPATINDNNDDEEGGLINNAFQEEETENNNDDEFREFGAEGSDHSPVNSVENVGLGFWDQQKRANRGGGSRVSISNGVNQNGSNSREEEEVKGCDGDGVREWLMGLGLGRYAPVFEIHEVDDEILPMLTLEDLKDMGINAVGSRRKMYSAILKLRKGFS